MDVLRVFMKHLAVIVLFFSAITRVQANEKHDVLLKVKGAYFYPSSHDFREIYGNGTGQVGGELDIKAVTNFYVWLSGDWSGAKGHSIGLESCTYVSLTSFALGLMYMYPVRYIDFYLGIGPQTSWVHTNNSSSFVAHSIDRWSWGGIVKSGMLINWFHGFIDIFANYSQMSNIHTGTHQGARVVQGGSGNTSGLSVGLGLGYRFGSRTRNRTD